MADDKADRAGVEREIHKHLKELHDKGTIDLDAPARDVIDVIQREFPAQAGLEPRAGGYWLVGDQGWCDHLT
jgi:hypothetical protein